MTSSLDIDKLFCVYCHTLKKDGRKYIGITSQKPRKRWSYGAGYEARTYIGKAIRKYGWDEFEHDILFEGLAEKEAKAKERELIALYDTRNPKKGFNLTDGGDGVCGYTPTPEVIEKLRISHLGICPSAESRKRLSASLKEYYKAHKGPTLTRERSLAMVKAREGLAVWNKGKHLSDETKKKLRDANLGKIASEQTRDKMRNSSPRKRRVVALDKLGNALTYNSISEACEALNIKTRSHVTECCKGTRKQYMGYKWEYYEH